MAKRNRKVGKVAKGTCKPLANGACVCKLANGKTTFKKKVRGACPK